MPPLAEDSSSLQNAEASLSLNWKENPSSKKLLDAIVSILAKEYIQTAKENPEIFSNKGDFYESCKLRKILFRKPKRKKH